MGIDTTTVVGSYLLVKNKVIIKKEIKMIYKNQKTNKIFKKKVKFDPDTGDPVERLTETIEVPETFCGWHDLYRELNEPENLNEDAFFQPEYIDQKTGYTILMPNGGKGTISTSDSGRGEQYTTEIEFHHIEKSKQEFEVEYSNEISALKDFYKEVEIKFGVITYSH